MKENDAYENERIIKNLVSLRHSPVQGNYDVEHLKSVHERVFHGTSFSPGEFREELPNDKIWRKERILSTQKIDYNICYSLMDDDSRDLLAKTLSNINIKKLKTLDKNRFVNELSNIYGKLDYIHPFKDGNSRTLREFTTQIAKEAGYSVEWSKLQGQKDYERLYRARDIETTKINQLYQKNSEIKEYCSRLERYIDNGQGMSSILQEITRPERARSFEHDTREDAIKKHPELKAAYILKDKAAAYAAIQYDRRESREKFMELMEKHIQEKLNNGETKDFKPTDRQKETIQQKSERVERER